MTYTFSQRIWRAVVLPIGLLLLLAQTVSAQSIQWSGGGGTAPLSPDAAFSLSHEEGADGTLVLGWDVTPGYYIYRDSLSVTGPDGTLPLDLPEAELTDDLTFGESWVYRADFDLTLPAPGGPVTVTWQGCQDGGICYPPQSTEISLATTTAPASVPASLTLTDEAGLMDRLGARGVPILLLAFFGFGLALSFTPCVLPMVPILGGLLARDRGTPTRMRGFALSATYVVAMAAAFGVLGMAAAATGQNLQLALQSALVLGVIAGLFVLLALSSFGMFEISLPARWVARFNNSTGQRRGTFGDALGLGFTSALVVGPCVTAPLAAALIYIAQTGDMALGSAALFMLGLGKGVPLVVFGTLGAHYLPRSGPWMERVKQGFGFVFLGLALWLASRIAPGPWFVALWALWFIALAAFLWLQVRRDARAQVAQKAVGGLAVLALGPALVLAVAAARGAPDPIRPFDVPDTDASQAQAWQNTTTLDGLNAALASADGPSVLYLTADWCVTCRTIDRNLLTRTDVIAAIEPLNRIKLDLSDYNDDAREILATLGAAGPPTMVFLDAELREPAQTRLIGDARHAAFLRSVQEIRP